MFQIKAKTKIGTEKLREMFIKNRNRRARLFIEMTILEQNPILISFKFKRIPDKLLQNETVKETLVNGLKKEIIQAYNLKESDFEVKEK